ncbi:MAG TPA: hypothetical protein ENK66_02680, partial [Arcobacter sp.]|nr:hypothetical protein [Arcobacter sp.]
MKKTIFFLLATLFSSTLSAYFLTQKVPLYFDFQYWDSSKSFESFSDIKDNYLCLERGDKCYCDIANSNPVCTIYDFDNNISIDIKDDLKKEKYNNLTIVDINDTFPDLDSFDGYNQNQQAVTSISNHPVNTEQDYFIVFGSSHVRKATDKETVYTKEFLHGLNDPSTLTKGSTEVTNDFNNKDYQNELGNYYDHNNTNNPNKQTDTQTATSNLYTHAGADSKKMEDIQDIIGES